MEIGTFRLERYFARHEFSARVLLSSSDCEPLTVAELLALEPGAAAALENLPLGYTETRGAPALRAGIATEVDGTGTIGPENIVVCSAGQEAILLALWAQRARRVVVQTPCYESHTAIPRALGAEVVPWPLVLSDELPTLSLPPPGEDGAPADAVLMCSPHNPTGHHASADELNVLLAHCAHHRTRLIVDEVYRGLEHRGRARVASVCTLDARAVSIGVMSKAYGLAGLRIGWVASRDRALLDEIVRLKDFTTIGASAPSEFLAGVALHHAEALRARCVARVEENLATLQSFCARRPDILTAAPTRAGSTVFPRLCVPDTEAFCDALVARTGVMLLPGTVFDCADRVRIGLGRTHFSEGLRSLEAYFDATAAGTRLS